jgi:hypothetical protein
MGITNFKYGLASQGVPLYGSGQDISGSTYFVDNNSGSDSNDGLTWESAFKTLAYATTISNLDIARGSDRWARRNTIYYCADTETATLTAFPNKCDVIGVGSYDANSKPGITGNHAPVNTGNYGTRFFNIWFKSPAVASPIITLASTSSGIQFHGCTFDGSAGTVTSAILATASPFLKVIDCEMFGAFATSYISFGAGVAASTKISGNMMTGSAGIGIIVASNTTSSYPSVVKDNIIVITDNSLCIDDDSDLFYYVDNRLMNQGTVTAWAHHTAVADVNADFAVGNLCTGSAGNQVTLGTTVGS